MTWTAPAANRQPEPTTGPERAMLQGWLDYHRQTLLLKCAGLTPDQLRTASAEPSTLTLHGLVRHMTYVERAWFTLRAAGRTEAGTLYVTDDDPDADLNVTAADAPADFAAYLAELPASDEAVGGLSLDHEFTHRGETFSLRWVYHHMIEEYARHNGHADLLRERLDGTTGD
ncbi:MAG: DinB family protein [Jiangellaceae bacterium]